MNEADGFGAGDWPCTLKFARANVIRMVMLNILGFMVVRGVGLRFCQNGIGSGSAHYMTRVKSREGGGGVRPFWAAVP